MLYVGGSGGKYMYCPNYKKGVCNCRTTLRKDLAAELIVQLIMETVASDEAWLEETFRFVDRVWRTNTDTLPGEIAHLEREIQSVGGKIERLLDRIEEGNRDANVERRLRQRQQERDRLKSRLADVQSQRSEKVEPPTKGWVQDTLRRLVVDAPAHEPATIEALQALLGGQVLVEEIRPENGRRFLRGHVTLKIPDATKLLLGRIGCDLAHDSQGDDGAIMIDFKEPSPLIARSERAKKLYDQGHMNAEIAQILGISRSMVTKLLKFWFESPGLEMPDGRSRRSTLRRKHLEQPYYQQISNQVNELMDQGLLLGEIGQVIGCDRNTVTRAARHWSESRGIEHVDGHARRTSLDRKVSD